MRFFLFITIAEYERLTKSGELIVTREYIYEAAAMDWLVTAMHEHGFTKPEDATMPHELCLLYDDGYWEYLPEDYGDEEQLIRLDIEIEDLAKNVMFYDFIEWGLAKRGLPCFSDLQEEYQLAGVYENMTPEDKAHFQRDSWTRQVLIPGKLVDNSITHGFCWKIKKEWVLSSQIFTPKDPTKFAEDLLEAFDI